MRIQNLIENMVFCNYVLDESKSMKERYYGIYCLLFCIRTKGEAVYCLDNLDEEDIQNAVNCEMYSDICRFVRNRILILVLIMAVQIKELNQFMEMLDQNLQAKEEKGEKEYG